MSDQDVGQRIRIRRKALGLSQTAVGQRMGVTHAAISDIERGQTHFTLALLQRIAAALETTPTALTDGLVAAPAAHEHYWLPGGYYPGAMTLTGVTLASPYQIIVCHCGAVKAVRL